MSLGSRRELELKLELTQAELQRVRSHPALGVLSTGEPVTRTLRSIYFDTPDHRLRAHGISVRVRSDGNGWRQTVKTGTAVAKGVSNPVEVEDAIERPLPDLRLIGDHRVRRKVEKAVDAKSLEPVFETVVERTTRQLHSAEGEVELALDEGVVRAGSAQDALCEAELELKSGRPECLLHTATELFAATPLRLATSSKAERGYGLALADAKDHFEPLRAEPPRLNPGHTCGEALGFIVQSAVAQIAANRQSVMESEDSAAAHQLRIGLRRLRSALAAFRPLADTPALREFEGHARTLARNVGELRDADVLIEDIFAPVAALMQEGEGAARVRAALLAHRAGARERVRSALGGEQWSVLQLHFALWPRMLDEAGDLDAPVTKLARSALKKRWRKVAESGRRLEELTVEERHAMRKALKTLRYTAEFFASLYPPRKTRPFIKQIRNLQEVFGYLNDVAAAKRLDAICHDACAESREAQRAAGFVLGWHSAQAARAWKSAHKGWKKLEGLHRFWA